MGWETNLFCNLTFNRQTFNSKESVQDRIDELEEEVMAAKAAIKNLILMTEPKKFCPDDREPLHWLAEEYNECMEVIIDNTIEIYKLLVLLDNWDHCHNEEGLAINPPDDINWRTAYLDGDFVNTVKYPNGGSL